jgi:hypothetical protein
VGLAALPLRCADCPEICEPDPRGTPRAVQGLAYRYGTLTVRPNVEAACRAELHETQNAFGLWHDELQCLNIFCSDTVDW